MTRPSAARLAALRLLSLARQRDAYARDLLRSSERLASLSPRDRALAERLVFGTVAARGTLDELLNRRLRRPRGVEPRVRDALRLSAFELLYLSTPERAVVSQGVELVRSVAPKAASMANAVLRRLAPARYDVKRARIALEMQRNPRPGQEPPAGEGPLANAQLAGALPSWLCLDVLRGRSSEGLAQLALAELEPAPLWCAGAPGVDALAALAEAGAEPEPTFLPGTVRLRRPAALAQSGLASAGVVVPSDLAAQMVALVATPADGGSLLEVGAGRGTKTLLVQAQLRRLGWQAQCAAVELSESKVRTALRRLEAAGVQGVRLAALDALTLGDGPALLGDDSGEDVGVGAVAPAPAEVASRALESSGPEDAAQGEDVLLASKGVLSAECFSAETFRTVLLDAPCSGTGTMRRHPEIPWSLDPWSVNPVNLDGLPALQGRLLRAAATRVAPGGTLLYATCSVLPQENRQVVEEFLASPEGADFGLGSVLDRPAVRALGSEDFETFSSFCRGRGVLQTTPTPGGCDGHFCACLVRKA